MWAASVLHGIPVYFVQDIETSYYPDDERMRDAVLASYRHEFRYMTISSWNRERLRELGLDAVLIPPGIDLDNFRPLPGRASGAPTWCSRSDAPTRSRTCRSTLAAWRALPEPRPELCLFGIEPELADGAPGSATSPRRPTPRSTGCSTRRRCSCRPRLHEGFCLPALEAMATGGAVVCTDAHGNRDFCTDGENCLMPGRRSPAVADAIARAAGGRRSCASASGSAGIADGRRLRLGAADRRAGARS